MTLRLVAALIIGAVLSLSPLTTLTASAAPKPAPAPAPINFEGFDAESATARQQAFFRSVDAAEAQFVAETGSFSPISGFRVTLVNATGRLFSANLARAVETYNSDIAAGVSVETAKSNFVATVRSEKANYLSIVRDALALTSEETARAGFADAGAAFVASVNAALDSYDAEIEAALVRFAATDVRVCRATTRNDNTNTQCLRGNGGRPVKA